jgi:hypothetical protein
LAVEAFVPATRVLIFPLPRLLHDIIHELLSDVAGVELVDCPSGVGGIAEAAVQTNAHLVIASERQAQPQAARALLQRMPRAHALAVSHDGRSAVLYDLRPHRCPIGELSAATVRAAVRAASPTADTQSTLCIDPAEARPDTDSTHGQAP